MQSQVAHGYHAGWPFQSAPPHAAKHDVKKLQGCQANIEVAGQAQDTQHTRTKKPNPGARSVQLSQRITFHNVFAKYQTPSKSPTFILEDLSAMNPLRGL